MYLNRIAQWLQQPPEAISPAQMANLQTQFNGLVQTSQQLIATAPNPSSAYIDLATRANNFRNQVIQILQAAVNNYPFHNMDVPPSAPFAGGTTDQMLARIPNFDSTEGKVLGILVVGGREYQLVSGELRRSLPFGGSDWYSGYANTPGIRAWNNGFGDLYFHVEGEAAAIMRHLHSTEGRLYLNLTPCLTGSAHAMGTGCQFQLRSSLLPHGVNLQVWAKTPSGFNNFYERFVGEAQR